MSKKVIMRIVFAALALSLGLMVGSTAMEDISFYEHVDKETYKYPVNEYGQTYGSALYATSPDNGPDLIWAAGVDDTLGFVCESDLIGELAKNPEEAAAMMERPQEPRSIPLYDVYGKTVIGEFIVSPGGLE